jgi:hypothetical protein
MKKKGLVFWVWLISTGFLYAQNDFNPGYVITIKGDTLFGKIDYRGDLYMKSICRFMTAENTINEYTPHDILAYRFIDSKYYISREVDGKSVFLEYLIKGKSMFIICVMSMETIII